ncbi:MAG: crossover junction endodeoxyribonuclease RuvC [Pseudomonadales bacterium]|nr:crossover junction endodeoxyribonuclease RuvC [Pseudomonadales bacterium]MCP5184544.1 crossover junction endodeoxyribonuclease RuvC [Pseudomonadales bacterium]
MRVLGIDPGSRITGYGVVDVIDGRIRYVASGCIRTMTGSIAERLQELYQGVQSTLAAYSPQQVAVEQIFIARNPASALKLGQARGVALAACMSEGVQFHDYAPRQVKLAVVGTGKASKQQVQYMVQALLKLPGAPQADAADALAVAICHVNTRRL